MNLKRIIALALCVLGISAFGATEIQEALDCTDLEFTTGEDAGWMVQSDVVHTGTSALRSGWIDNDEQTYVETTITGEGLLAFQWKVSSEDGCDFLFVFVDGECRGEISGEQDWSAMSIVVSGDGEHAVQWVYEKDGSVSSGLDCGWLDAVKWTPAPEKMTMKFVLNGGKGATSGDFLPGDTYGKLPKPTKSGTDFLGWCRNSDCSDLHAESELLPYENATFYAKWGWSLSRIAADGLDVHSTDFACEKREDGKFAAFCTVPGSASSACGPEKEYVLTIGAAGTGTLSFDWFASSYADVEVRFWTSQYGDEWVTSSVYLNGEYNRWNYCETLGANVSKVTVSVRNWNSSDVRVGIASVKWTAAPEEITVKFVTNGGSTCEPAIYCAGTYGYELPVPEREGYVFGGWYLESSFKTKIGQYDYVPFKSSLTLYAKWDLPLSVLNHDGLSFSEEVDDESRWSAEQIPDKEESFAAVCDLKSGWTSSSLQMSGLSGVGTLSFDICADSWSSLRFEYGKMVSDEWDSWFASLGSQVCQVDTPGQWQHIDVPIVMSDAFLVRWSLNGYGPGLTRLAVANVKWTLAPEEITVKYDTDGGKELADGKLKPGATYGDLLVPEREGYAFVGWIDPNEQGVNPLTGEPLIRLFGKSEMLPFAAVVQVKALWGLPLEGFDTKDLAFVNDGDFLWFVAEGVKGEGGGAVARALACGSTESWEWDDETGDEILIEKNTAKLMTQVSGYGTLTFRYRANPAWGVTDYGMSIGWLQFTCDVDGFTAWSGASTMSFDEQEDAVWRTGQVTVCGEGEHVICWQLFNDAVTAACAELCDVVWTPAPASMTVSFDSDEGSSVDPRVFEPGDPYGELPVPVREGWEFLGWYERTAVGVLPGPLVNPEQLVPFSDIALVAKWGRSISEMTDAGLTFTTAGTDQFRLTSVKTPGGNCAAEAQPTSDSNPERSGFGAPTEYVNPTLNTTVKGSGFLSFKYAVGAEASEDGFSAGGYLTTFRVSVDGKVVRDDMLPDPGSWQNVNLLLEGASTKVHKISIEVGGSGIVSCFVGDFTFEKTGSQESLEAWADKVTNYKVWTKGDLTKFAGEYEKRIAADTADYEARIFHAACILANLAENKDFQAYAKTFGYTLDYAHCAFTGTLKLDSKTAQMNAMVDKAIVVAQPVMLKAIEDLKGIPDDWTGIVKLSAENWPVDEDVYLDLADVLFAKASLQGGIGLLQLLGGYDLTVDWAKAKAEHAYDPTKAVTDVTSLPGVNDDAEWLRVSPIAGDGEVVKEVRLVKCGERLAVLMEAPENRTFDDLAAASFDLKSTKGNLSLSRVFIEGVGQPSTVFGTVGDEFVYGEIPVTYDASREGFLLLTFDLQGKNVALASTAWKFTTGEASAFGDDGALTDVEWEYSATPARWQKAIQEQTKFFSKVRNLARVQNAKDWTRNALQTALDADKAVLARTDDRLHFVEYDDFDAERVDIARKNTEKALEALDSDEVKFDLAELFANGKIAEDYDFTLLPGGGNMTVYLGAFFTGTITREYMPFTYLDEYGLLRIDCLTMKDPTFAGLFPEMSAAYWTDFLKQSGSPEDHPVQETPFVPGEKVSLACARLIGYKASGLPKGWKWDSAKGLLTGTASGTGFEVKFTSGSHVETVKFAVDPLPLLSVDVGDDGVVSVGGSGSYKANAAVKARAEVASGFAFVGWFNGKGELVSKDKIYSFKMPVVDVELTAKSIALAEDGLYFSEVVSEIKLAKGEQVDSSAGAYFVISSGSAYVLAASGLPSGISLTKIAESSYVLTGAPKKAGVFYATLTAKNNGGFTASQVIRFVIGGAEEALTNTANIDFSHFTEEATPSTGNDFWFYAEVPCHSSGSYAKSVKVTGLPSGYSYDFWSPKANGESGELEIWGVAKKAGVYTVTVTVTYANKKTAKTVAKVIVENSGSVYIPAVIAPGCEGLGTVSGGGVKAYGSTVTLTAKVNSNKKKDYVFAGWYLDPNFEYPADYWTESGEWRSPALSFVANILTTYDGGVCARFIAKAEDAISFAEEQYELQVPQDLIDRKGMLCWEDEASGNVYCYEEPKPNLTVSVSSASLPTVKASGVPAGFKFSGMTLKLMDYAKVKPGVHTVKLTATNVSGNKATATIIVRVPNLKNVTHLYGLNTDNGMEGEDSDGYTFDAGVPPSTCDLYDLLDISVEEGWTLKVTGLPSGWKLSGRTLSGAATVTGPITVTFTLTKRGEPTEEATATFNMRPLPDYVVGTFGGAVRKYRYSESAETMTDGLLTVTVSAFGKASGSYNCGGSKVSLSGKITEFDGVVYTFDLIGKVSNKKKTFKFFVMPDGASFYGEISASESIDSGSLSQDPLKKVVRDGVPVPLFKETFERSIDWSVPYGSTMQAGTLAVRFVPGGSVKAVWTYNGKSLSATVPCVNLTEGDGVFEGLLVVGMPPDSRKKLGGVYAYVYFSLTLDEFGVVTSAELTRIAPYFE